MAWTEKEAAACYWLVQKVFDLPLAGLTDRGGFYWLAGCLIAVPPRGHVAGRLGEPGAHQQEAEGGDGGEGQQPQPPQRWHHQHCQHHLQQRSVKFSFIKVVVKPIKIVVLSLMFVL